MAANQRELADRLVELGYIDLFLSMGHESLESLWNEADAPKKLAALAVDSNAQDEARFLAVEILFTKDSNYPPDSAKKSLAAVYAAALKNNFTKMANPWGLPGRFDGEAGEHLMALGETAVPELIPLLEDNTVLPYGGSQEATLARQYNYRVKDFAAYFISRIRGLPYQAKESPEARDADIERLKNQL